MVLISNAVTCMFLGQYNCSIAIPRNLVVKAWIHAKLLIQSTLFYPGCLTIGTQNSSLGWLGIIWQGFLVMLLWPCLISSITLKYLYNVISTDLPLFLSDPSIPQHFLCLPLPIYSIAVRVSFHYVAASMFT